MKIISVQATNFGSYKELNFSNEGLSLVYGRTGAGKSTIPDVVAWTLFGTTAKDGAADDVRSWQADGPTYAKIITDSFIVERKRGKGVNDLQFYGPIDSGPTRGKDLTETQKLLEQRLGVSAELFIAASYYHEFSPTGAFFTATAKNRRNLFEKLAPLELPKLLAEKSSEKKKTVKVEIAKKELEFAKITAQADQIQKSLTDNDRMSAAHIKAKEQKLAKLKDLAANYNLHREQKLTRTLIRLEQIDVLLLPDSYFDELLVQLHPSKHNPPCPTCGVQKQEYDFLSTDATEIQSQKYKNSLLRYEQDTLLAKLEEIQNETNTYSHQIDQLQSELNPFDGQEAKLVAMLVKAEGTMSEVDAQLRALEGDLSVYDTLYDISSALRGELLKTAVRRIEDDTNKYLETHFDAEIRVSFSLEGSDSLVVGIQKSGYECNYKQLSKGQRGLLKLCFSVSVMKLASERCGVHFENLFFDEALDGLDTELKLKAFGLLQQLSTEHSSVLVIDHCEEFQNLFDKRYLVTLEGDYSAIKEQNEF